MQYNDASPNVTDNTDKTTDRTSYFFSPPA